MNCFTCYMDQRKRNVDLTDRRNRTLDFQLLLMIHGVNHCLQNYDFVFALTDITTCKYSHLQKITINQS